jgi:hypothetical protein
MALFELRKFLTLTYILTDLWPFLNLENLTVPRVLFYYQARRLVEHTVLLTALVIFQAPVLLSSSEISGAHCPTYSPCYFPSSCFTIKLGD